MTPPAMPTRARATRWCYWPPTARWPRGSRRWSAGAPRPWCACWGGIAAGERTRRPTARTPDAPGLAPAAWEAERWRVIDRDPHTVGVASATWTTRLLADYLAAQMGHAAGIETVRLALHRGKYVCKRPTWTLPRKAEEQEGWATPARGYPGSRWRSS